MNTLKRDYPEPPAIPGVRYIQLGHGYFSLVDEEDYERANQFLWYRNTVGKSTDLCYACRSYVKGGKRFYVRLHHLIIGSPQNGNVIDHINGDGLDNRKVNLRECTHAQNMRNSRKKRNRSSSYKGVHFDKNSQKWLVHISVGSFHSEQEAAIAYNEAAKLLFGEHVKLNDVSTS